jgi:hypothetical protein
MVRTRVNGIMRDSDITGKFLQCLVQRLSSPRTLHSESCEFVANTVHLTRKVFWNRKSERADGLRVPYNGKQAGFSFRVMWPGAENSCSLVSVSSSFSPPPRLSLIVSIFHRSGVYLRCLRITQDLHVESTSPTVFPDTVSLLSVFVQ